MAPGDVTRHADQRERGTWCRAAHPCRLPALVDCVLVTAAGRGWDRERGPDALARPGLGGTPTPLGPGDHVHEVKTPSALVMPLGPQTDGGTRSLVPDFCYQPLPVCEQAQPDQGHAPFHVPRRALAVGRR